MSLLYRSVLCTTQQQPTTVQHSTAADARDEAPAESVYCILQVSIHGNDYESEHLEKTQIFEHKDRNRASVGLSGTEFALHLRRLGCTYNTSSVVYIIRCVPLNPPPPCGSWFLLLTV